MGWAKSNKQTVGNTAVNSSFIFNELFELWVKAHSGSSIIRIQGREFAKNKTVFSGANIGLRTLSALIQGLMHWEKTQKAYYSRWETHAPRKERFIQTGEESDINSPQQN
jgi:hypothetical protein